MTDRIGYISTAGGAFLEFLEGRELPGVAALTDAPRERAGAADAHAAGRRQLEDARSPPEARELAQAVRDGLKRPRGVEVAICPPFTALHVVGSVLAGSPIALGAQNCHWEDAGAFTGESPPPCSSELGCKLVILGHSERRHLFRETDEEVSRKVAAALRHGLTPLLCVGETAEERRRDRAWPSWRGS